MTVGEFLTRNDPETVAAILAGLIVPWGLLFLDLGDALRDHLRRRRERAERIRRGEIRPD